MNRERTYYPRDDAPISGGDVAFAGVNCFVQPSQLPQGFLADGRNFRCENGVVETRPGLTRVLWANYTTLEGRLIPWPDMLAAPVQFEEPSGAEWTIWASTPGAYATRANNSPRPIPLPPGVDLIARVSFVQAFNRLYLDRDHGNSLVLDDLDLGFVDTTPHWSVAAEYTPASLVMWGQWIAIIDFTVENGVASITTFLPHQLGTGQDVLIRNASVALVAGGRRTATVIDEFNFTCFMELADGSYLGSGTQMSPIDHAWRPAAPGAVVIKVTSLSHAGLVATATSVAHGLRVNDVVNMAGATAPEYNGPDKIVTFVAADSFKYALTGVPAMDTGTNITAAIKTMAVGSEPGVHPGWVRDYTAMPAGIHGVYTNNRRLLPTRWNPSADLATGAYAGRRDFVAASYVTDNSRFTVANEFRINQGSSDELLNLVKLGPSTVVCLKSASVGLLNNVVGDLSALSLEMLITNYGLANPHAVCLGGRDVFFMAPRRGVVSLTQTAQGQIQGVDVPLSRPIQPWIDRINWGFADKIRLAYHDNMLRVAVPLDDARSDGADWFANLEYTGTYELGAASAIPLVNGATYRWTPDPDAAEFLTVGGVNYTEELEFVWEEPQLVSISQIEPAVVPVLARSSFCRVYTGVNNTVLTYDFLVGAWQAMDTGVAMGVAEWFVATCNGRERLLCFTVDMTAAIYDDHDCGTDQVYDPVAPAGIAFTKIDSELLTRGYLTPEQGEKRIQFAEAVVATWNPKYTLAARTEGVEEEQVLFTDLTRDRTRYFRPATRPRWDETNINDDFNTPWREDYSVAPGIRTGRLMMPDGALLLLPDGEHNLRLSVQGGVLLHDGIRIDQLQARRHRVRAGRREGRWHQLRLRNRQGRLELRAVTVETIPGTRHEGAGD